MIIQIKPLYDYPQDHLETLMVNTRSIQRVVRWPSVSHAVAVGQIFMLGYDNAVFALQVNAADMAAIESAIRLDNIVDQTMARPLPGYEKPAPPVQTEARGSEATHTPRPEGFQGNKTP